MRIFVLTLGLFISCALSGAQPPERHDLSIQGKWRIEGNALLLQIENRGGFTILMEDPTCRIPDIRIAKGYMKGLLSGIFPGLAVDEALFLRSVESARAYWFPPMKVNYNLAVIAWQIELPPEEALRLERNRASKLEMSGLEGSVVRDEDIGVDAKTMLLTRFTTTVKFEYVAAKNRDAEPPR